MRKHPSVVNINNKNFESTFSFKKTTLEEVVKVIRNLNIRKSCQTADIPTKIIKLNSDNLAKFIYKHSAAVFIEVNFQMKHAELVPVNKKNCKRDKENYRTVRIPWNVSKVYEKVLYSQLYNYFEKILFPNQCGFRKSYSAQQCLLVMTEKFKEAIDRRDKFGALLTNLYKALNCINHPLLIAKINSYGVSPMSTKVIFSYLSNYTERTKIKNRFSKKSNTLHGVPQGSILALLPFNIDFIDLF